MQERMIVGAEPPPPSESGEEAARGSAGPLDNPRALQILTTEHWSLLASRAQTYNESFARAGMVFSTLSAGVIALALVAQASGFGGEFVIFALVVLAFALFVCLVSYVRLGQVSNEELRYVAGMNRIRHAYLEIEPGLEPYFITSRYDDWPGQIVSILGMKPMPSRIPEFLHGFVTMAGMIGTILAMVAALFAALVAIQLGQQMGSALVVGVLAFFGVVAGLAVHGILEWNAFKAHEAPVFPTPPEDALR
jgi:hypothetical protein